MRIAIYGRKSKFTGVGDSIENQIQMCKDFINSKYGSKEIIFDEYEDEGFTGGNLNRPQFQKMMNCIKNYDILVCYRLDRISRNVADFSTTLETLQANNCDFISIKEQFDTSSPMGRAMIYIASVFAQLERETIAERVRDNMLEMAKNGCWLGGPAPAGYNRILKECLDEHGNVKEIAYLEQNPEEIKLIEKVYDVYLDTGSISSTEKYLMQHNIKTSTGTYFAKSTLNKILKNPIYVKSSDKVLKFLKNDGLNVYGEADRIHGILIYNKTSTNTINGKKQNVVKDKSEWIATVSNRCEGFLSDDKWLSVQERINKNKELSPRAGKTNNALLTSKLRCSKCGSSMGILYGHTNKETGLKKIYYKCSLKKRSGNTLCSSKNIDANKLEQYILDNLQSMSKNKQTILKELKKVNISKNKNNNLEKEINKINKQIESKNNIINGLMDKLALLDTEFTDIVLKKIKHTNEEIKALEHELSALEVKTNSTNKESYDLEFVEKLLNKCENINELDIDDKKRLIDFLIDEINYDVENNQITIYPIGSKKGKKKESMTWS